MKKLELAKIIKNEILKEFKGFPLKGKIMVRVKDKAEAEKYLEKLKVKYGKEEKEVSGFTWYDGQDVAAELNKNTLVVYENTNTKKGEKLNEVLDSADYEEIKSLIRAEIAAVLFDLYKKRTVWV